MALGFRKGMRRLGGHFEEGAETERGTDRKMTKPYGTWRCLPWHLMQGVGISLAPTVNRRFQNHSRRPTFLP